MRTRPALVAALAASVLAAACTSSPPPAAPPPGASSSAPPTAAGARWLAFDAYPGARPLCNEHLTGAPSANGPGMHLSWQSYATRDDLATVSAFYREHHAGFIESAKDAPLTLAADADTKLSLHALGEHPTCSVPPTVSEKTIIVVSRATRPAPPGDSSPTGEPPRP